MASRKPLIATDGEVHEMTAGDLAKFKPAAELLSPSREGSGACRDARKHQPKSASPFDCCVKWLSESGKVATAGKRAWTPPCESGSRVIHRRKSRRQLRTRSNPAEHRTPRNTATRRIAVRYAQLLCHQREASPFPRTSYITLIRTPHSVLNDSGFCRCRLTSSSTTAATTSRMRGRKSPTAVPPPARRRTAKSCA